MGKKAAPQANIPGLPPPAPKQAPAPKKEKAAPKQEAVPEASAKKAAAAPKEGVPAPKAAATSETAPPAAAKAKAAAAGAKAPAAKAAGAKAGAKAKAPQPPPPVVEPVQEEAWQQADEAKKKKTRRGGAKKKAGDEDFAEEATTKAVVINLAKQEADAAAAGAAKDADLAAITKKICAAEGQIEKGGASYALRKELESLMEEIEKQVASKKAKVPKATGPAAMLAQSMQELEAAEGADFDLGMLEDVRKQLDDARAAEVYGVVKTQMIALKARCEAGVNSIASAAQSNTSNGKGAGKNDALMQEQREAAALEKASSRLATLLGKEGEVIPAHTICRQTLVLDPEVMAYLFLPPHSFKQRFERHHHVVIDGNRPPKGSGKTASTVPKELTLTGAGTAEVEKCAAALQAFDSYSDTKEEVDIGYTVKDEIEQEFSVICVKPRTSKGTTVYGSKANVAKAFARAMAPKAQGPVVSATMTIDTAKVQAMRSLLNGWRITTETDIKVDAPETGMAKITIKAKTQEAVDAAKEKVQSFDKTMAVEVFECDASRVQGNRMAYRKATEAHKDVTVARDDAGLRLIGPPAELKLIKEKLQDLAKKSTQELVKQEIPAEQIRIFGRETLQQISKKSGATVRRSREEGDNNSLVISGDEDAIQKAKSAIEEVLKKEGATDSLSISEELVKALLINSGAKIRDIEKRVGVSMNIDKKDTKVLLLGSESGLQAAKSELQAMQAKVDQEAAETHTSNVEVPTERIRFVIGPKGRELNRIKDSCGVQVNIKDSGEETSVVELKGKEDDVAKAEAMIQEILESSSDKVPADKDSSKVAKSKGKGKTKGKGKGKEEEQSSKKGSAPKAAAFKEGEMDFPTLGGEAKADDKPKTAALGAWGKKAEEKEAKKSTPKADNAESFPALNGKAAPKQEEEDPEDDAAAEEEEKEEKQQEVAEQEEAAEDADDPFAMMSGMGEEVVYKVTLMEEKEEKAEEAAPAEEAGEDCDDPFAMMSGMGEEVVYKVTLLEEKEEEKAAPVPKEAAKPAAPEPVKEATPGFQETETDFPTLGSTKATAAPKAKGWAGLFNKK